MNELITKDAEEIYYSVFGKTNYYVKNLVPQGLNILCGASKAGKSWLVLWLCLQICKGEAVWERETLRSDCLYLCLEDNEKRIQSRLHTLTDEPPDNLRFGFICDKASDGLKEQIEQHLLYHPQTGFIVIDTLQKVRGDQRTGGTQYANDYEDLSIIKSLADTHNICILLVHHTRKQADDRDLFNEVNGTTGITGTVDNMYLLKKKERYSDSAVLSATGRDIVGQQIALKFVNNVWEFVDCQGGDEVQTETVPPFIFSVGEYVKQCGEFSGTITELLSAIEVTDIAPNKASKFLSKFYSEVLEPENITMQSTRHARGRVFNLRYAD